MTARLVSISDKARPPRHQRWKHASCRSVQSIIAEAKIYVMIYLHFYSRSRRLVASCHAILLPRDVFSGFSTPQCTRSGTPCNYHQIEISAWSPSPDTKGKMSNETFPSVERTRGMGHRYRSGIDHQELNNARQS